MGDNRLDMRLALNAEINAQGTSENASVRDVPVTIRSNYHPGGVNKLQTEWNMGVQSNGGGTFHEAWPPHLPRPPSRRRIRDDETITTDGNSSGSPHVIVFNANTSEGSSIVRVLAAKGLRVTAVVRVFVNRNTKLLTKLKHVTVKVADLNNAEAVMQAAQGCTQAFLVTKYWERFENTFEEAMAEVVLRSSAEVGIRRLVLVTFEDTSELRRRNLRSQIIPTVDGRVYPKFEAMQNFAKMAKSINVKVQHMFTSYLNDGEHRKVLTLIASDNGKLHMEDSEAKKDDEDLDMQ